LMAVSQTYVGIAEKVIGRPLVLAENPRQEIIDTLRSQFALID
jgi:phosphoribosylaminoimidazole-succinocarboxamide synthase